MLASSKQFAGLRLILFCTGLAVQMYSYQFCKKISVAQQILRWVWPWSHTFLLMVVLDCHFPLSCRQGYTLCCIHYVDDGTQISCISCRQLKLHYKFMYELTPPLALLVLFALIVLEKWIYNIFVIWWPSLDCTGSNKICLGTLSYSFHSQWISLIFAQNPCFGRVQSPNLSSIARTWSILCNGIVSQLQQSCEFCNSAIWCHSEGEKVLVQNWFVPPPQKKKYFCTQKKSQKSHRQRQTNCLKAFRIGEMGWYIIVECWMKNLSFIVCIK